MKLLIPILLISITCHAQSRVVGVPDSVKAKIDSANPVTGAVSLQTGAKGSPGEKWYETATGNTLIVTGRNKSAASMPHDIYKSDTSQKGMVQGNKNYEEKADGMISAPGWTDYIHGSVVRVHTRRKSKTDVLAKRIDSLEAVIKDLHADHELDKFNIHQVYALCSRRIDSLSTRIRVLEHKLDNKK